jgi:hypothetical protein
MNAMTMRILQTLMRYAKNLNKPGIRGSGVTKSGRKVSGRLKTLPDGRNYVISNQGVPTQLTKEAGAKFRSKAQAVSTARKTVGTGAVSGGVLLGTASSANKGASKDSEPTATEKKPMGMKFSKAPSLKSTGIKASQPKASAGSFSAAFAKAYAGGKGKDSTFTFKGKDGVERSYAAVTKEDVKASGSKNLREYLNKRNKKKKKSGY